MNRRCAGDSGANGRIAKLNGNHRRAESRAAMRTPVRSSLRLPRGRPREDGDKICAAEPTDLDTFSVMRVHPVCVPANGETEIEVYVSKSRASSVRIPLVRVTVSGTCDGAQEKTVALPAMTHMPVPIKMKVRCSEPGTMWISAQAGSGGRFRAFPPDQVPLLALPPECCADLVQMNARKVLELEEEGKSARDAAEIAWTDSTWLAVDLDALLRHLHSTQNARACFPRKSFNDLFAYMVHAQAWELGAYLLSSVGEHTGVALTLGNQVLDSTRLTGNELKAIAGLCAAEQGRSTAAAKTAGVLSALALSFTLRLRKASSSLLALDRNWDSGKRSSVMEKAFVTIIKGMLLKGVRHLLVVLGIDWLGVAPVAGALTFAASTLQRVRGMLGACA